MRRLPPTSARRGRHKQLSHVGVAPAPTPLALLFTMAAALQRRRNIPSKTSAGPRTRCQARATLSQNRLKIRRTVARPLVWKMPKFQATRHDASTVPSKLAFFLPAQHNHAHQPGFAAAAAAARRRWGIATKPPPKLASLQAVRIRTTSERSPNC